MTEMNHSECLVYFVILELQIFKTSVLLCLSGKVEIIPSDQVTIPVKVIDVEVRKLFV